MRKLIGAVAILTALAAPAGAQEWPSKQVNLIVPFSAGGTTDLFGRLLAQHMHQKFGQPFIVENRAGAGGNLGAAAVAKAAPDGYTFLVGTVSTHAINPFIYTKLPYDTVKDFQPVSLIARLPNILVVHPSLPANNVQELIAHLKANPDKLSYGSSGVGTSIHLAAELFKIKTGTTMTHVPFRSSGDIMNNLTGGHINLAFDNITLAWPQVKAGNLRALAVSSTERSAIAPDVPTVADTIPGFEATSWHGVFAPAGTPKPIVDKMAAEMKRILELPDVKDKLFEIGAVASPMTPEDFAKFIDGERAKWADVVKAAGVKMD
ncbi:MAG: putative tricarboxylic transport rane protein [Hyphomicrobiales bacterium]|jgi:tripartite-type tricarboxylate transporter receptor subunit TctC|nr:putative tricarboxylic transport rane protein [Hyphomicrobiales bacterium]